MVVRFLPNDFQVPSTVWQNYHIRPLRMDDVIKDFTCYMSCVDYLREGNFFQPPGMPWIDFPRHDMTIRDALVLLGVAENAMDLGQRIEYGIFHKDETHEIGCVYLAPSMKEGVDAEMTFWLKEDIAKELTASLQQHLSEWLRKEFSFLKTVVFPGRELSWQAWAEMPNGR